ncbi:phage shock protein operon transcriptional activator [Porticoccus sp. W117]|uniref:phage shock protein operon transcriptional activator n=1 Tax=Porticoccus sp. W117 TaxID=3054777 RepID=UPI00259A1452|nr:phage shock protein operon transcriptional activator [Porticoccus sp. W117]MDM3870761.1 phage shock protein operon transcriptional activator [Porticoccus sp. W117]
MSEQRIIGESPAWVEALDQVSQLAPINRAALVLGERGTGKELVAERLHYLSPRWDQAFIKVNCATYTDGLLESELFGYEPGAFTGATRLHRGHFERADGGTLFLDELGTLPNRVQEKVLRIIEYGEFERLGGQQAIAVDVRIVAATNADLKAMADNHVFRHDLLDRLAFDVINLPSLRQRTEDIRLLCEHFAVRMGHELGWEVFPGFSANAMRQLHQYHWPGNVRELKNVVERSVYRWGNPEEAIGQVIIDPFTTNTQSSEVVAELAQAIAENAELPNFSEATDKFATQLLQRALEENQFHQGKAAESLGLTYHQFRGLYRKHDLANLSASDQ